MKGKKLTMERFIELYNNVMAVSIELNGGSIRIPSVDALNISEEFGFTISTITAYVKRFRNKYNITGIAYLDAKKFTKITGVDENTFSASKVGLTGKPCKNLLTTKSSMLEEFKSTIKKLDERSASVVDEYLDTLDSEERMNFISSNPKDAVSVLNKYYTDLIFKLTYESEINEKLDIKSAIECMERNIKKMEDILASVYTLNDIKSLAELEEAITKYKQSIEVRDDIIALITA